MSPLDRLGNYIIEVPIKLRCLTDNELTQHTPDKWSRKQLLGHLIDSAINNLKRFTEAQFGDEPYKVIPYNQNQLVVFNQYQDLPLAHLLTLWATLNQQILFVTKAIPDETLARSIQLGSTGKSPELAELKTIGWLIEDYVIHLEHHLKTLL